MDGKEADETKTDGGECKTRYSLGSCGSLGWGAAKPRGLAAFQTETGGGAVVGGRMIGILGSSLRRCQIIELVGNQQAVPKGREMRSIETMSAVASR